MTKQPSNEVLLNKLENIDSYNRESHTKIEKQLKYMNGTQRKHNTAIELLKKSKVDKEDYAIDKQSSAVKTSTMSIKLGIIISAICVVGSCFGAYIVPKIIEIIFGG